MRPPWAIDSQQLRAVRHRPFRHRQHDTALLVVKAGDEHFGLERPDALRWKIDDADHLAAYQFLLAVQRYDLRARLANADLRAEIDAQPPGRLARLGEIEHFEDRSDAQLNALEIGPLNLLHPPMLAAAGVQRKELWDG